MAKIPDAIYFKDTESRFLRISQAQAKRFNLTDPALAIGKTDADFFSGAHAGQALADELKAMKTGKPLVGIEEMETWPDGSVTWVSTTKMPLRDPSGKIIGTFGISRDITSRKLAELALEERTRQLQQKNRPRSGGTQNGARTPTRHAAPDLPLLPAGPALQEQRARVFQLLLSPAAPSAAISLISLNLRTAPRACSFATSWATTSEAALVTAMVRSLVEDLSPTIQDPGELLTQINRGLSSVFKQTGATMFATAFYLIADVATGEMRYASAAHPDALHLRRASGELEPLRGGDQKKGPALGLFDDAQFTTCRRPLSVGDLLILFTDGLTEAEGTAQECFTPERFAAAVQRRIHLPSGEMLKAVLEETRQFCGNGAFSDDVSLVGVEIKRLRVNQDIN